MKCKVTEECQRSDVTRFMLFIYFLFLSVQTHVSLSYSTDENPILSFFFVVAQTSPALRRSFRLALGFLQVPRFWVLHYFQVLHLVFSCTKHYFSRNLAPFIGDQGSSTKTWALAVLPAMAGCCFQASQRTELGNVWVHTSAFLDLSVSLWFHSNTTKFILAFLYLQLLPNIEQPSSRYLPI